jgi:hypothetical protein
VVAVSVRARVLPRQWRRLLCFRGSQIACVFAVVLVFGMNQHHSSKLYKLPLQHNGINFNKVFDSTDSTQEISQRDPN